jgi:hypothetical protein
MWELYAQKQKSNKRLMAETIVGETKGKAKERSKHEQLTTTKKWKKVNPFCGRKLFHPRLF